VEERVVVASAGNICCLLQCFASELSVDLLKMMYFAVAFGVWGGFEDQIWKQAVEAGTSGLRSFSQIRSI